MNSNEVTRGVAGILAELGVDHLVFHSASDLLRLKVPFLCSVFVQLTTPCA